MKQGLKSLIGKDLNLCITIIIPIPSAACLNVYIKRKEKTVMDKKLIAIPTIKGRLCASLGRCEKFAIVELKGRKILQERYIDPPAHRPGAYPKFLADYGVSIIITGGLGNEAYQIFHQNNIKVFVGVCLEKPEDLVRSYLKDELKKGTNISEHLW